VFAFGDHAPAERLQVLTDAYVKLKKINTISPSLMSNIQLAILSHLFFISSLEKYSGWHNHAIIFDEKMIASLQKLTDFRNRTGFLKLAYTRVFEQYRFSFTIEGVHKEHSPCYHNWLTGLFENLISSAKEEGISVPGQISELQQLAFEFTRTVDLMGSNFVIGDCSRSPVKIPKRRTLDIDGSLNYRTFPLSGWFFAIGGRRNEVRFAAQSDFHSLAHYQRDETSFVLSAAGHELIVDPGLYSYAESPVYTFYRSSRAHNMTVVDGFPDVTDLSLTGLSGITRFCSHFPDQVNDDLFAIEMSNPHYKKSGTEIHRQFYFTGGYDFVIIDVVTAKSEINCRQLFHLAPGARITKSDGGFLVKWKAHDISLFIDGNEDSYEITEGRKEPMQGWYFPGFNEMVSAPVLELKKKGDQLNFITYISIRGNPQAKSFRKESMRQLKSLIPELEKVQRRELIHQMVPNQWKIVRDSK
jgi:hypothetical protein